MHSSQFLIVCFLSECISTDHIMLLHKYNWRLYCIRFTTKNYVLIFLVFIIKLFQIMDERSRPGLDAALHELGMLSTVTSSRKEYLREKLERQRQAGPPGSPPLSRSCERPLQPSQAWNMPVLTGSIESGGWGWSPPPSDNENNENTFRFDRLKAVPVRLGLLSVVEMNPQYIMNVDVSEHRRSCPARLAQLSAATHRQHHLKPYNIPWRREERVRTKSENEQVEPSVAPEPAALAPPPTPLFRSRSLEDVRSAPAELEELDEMSREIQRLHVNE